MKANEIVGKTVRNMVGHENMEVTIKKANETVGKTVRKHGRS